MAIDAASIRQHSKVFADLSENSATSLVALIAAQIPKTYEARAQA